VDWERGGTKLWRTDFFPGLGWMLRAELWHELRQNWPGTYRIYCFNRPGAFIFQPSENWEFLRANFVICQHFKSKLSGIDRA
jgi:hypothetical protein